MLKEGQMMKRKANSFSAFIYDELEHDLEDPSPIPVALIERAYSRYCIKHGITKREPKLSVKNIKLADFGGYKVLKRVGGKHTWVWKDIKFKYPDEEMLKLEDEEEEILQS